MSLDPTTTDDRSPLGRLLSLQPEVVRALADPLRAATVSVLLERGEPMSLDALVAWVTEPGVDAAASRTSPDASEASRREIADSLALHHLPTLADAGLVAFDRDDWTVWPTDHPVVTHGLVDPSLLNSLSASTWRVAEALAGFAVRRRVLTVLADDPGPISLSRLVTASSTRSAAAAPGPEMSGPASGRLATDLHHLHLPKLEDVGLLAYDAPAHVVERLPNPTVEYDRLARAIATSAHTPDVDGAGSAASGPSSGDLPASDPDEER